MNHLPGSSEITDINTPPATPTVFLSVWGQSAEKYKTLKSTIELLVFFSSKTSVEITVQPGGPCCEAVFRSIDSLHGLCIYVRVLEAILSGES